MNGANKYPRLKKSGGVFSGLLDRKCSDVLHSLRMTNNGTDVSVEKHVSYGTHCFDHLAFQSGELLSVTLFCPKKVSTCVEFDGKIGDKRKRNDPQIA